jgi:serine/threonine protein phosphatase 1
VPAKKRTLIIGDIHGCYNELMELLKKVHYHPAEDRLISLGDLIHKGPLSWKVLNFFYENNLEVIMGNHDWHFLEALKSDNKMYNEGEQILKKSGVSRKKLTRWMESFPYYIKDKGFIAVHACFDPSKEKYSETDPHDMITGRFYDSKTKKISSTSRPTSSKHMNPWYTVYPEKSKQRIVVFGHWAHPQPRFHKNFRCIDTGCCYGGDLSCLIVPEDKLVTVKSQQHKKFDY